MFRFNDAPTLGFEAHVGRKSTYRLLSPEHLGFREARRYRQRFMDSHGDREVLLQARAHSQRTFPRPPPSTTAPFFRHLPFQHHASSGLGLPFGGVSPKASWRNRCPTSTLGRCAALPLRCGPAPLLCDPALVRCCSVLCCAALRCAALRCAALPSVPDAGRGLKRLLRCLQNVPDAETMQRLLVWRRANPLVELFVIDGDVHQARASPALSLSCTAALSCTDENKTAAASSHFK